MLKETSRLDLAYITIINRFPELVLNLCQELIEIVFHILVHL